MAVNPQNTSILYAENDSLSIQKSINGGAKFDHAKSGITDSKDTFLFITPSSWTPTPPTPSGRAAPALAHH